MENNDIQNEVHNEEIIRTNSNEEVIKRLLEGYCLILEKSGKKEGFLLKALAAYDREVTEPSIEQTIQGANVGFVESIDKNIFLLRQNTRTPKLTVKSYTFGTVTTTDVRIVYVEGLANPEVIKKLEKRLKYFNVDSIRSPGDITDSIEDHTFTPFPQLLLTERPDRASANLKDGKVVLLIDGSPVAIVLPATFMSFFSTPDDYITRWELGSFFRFLRLFSYMNALLLPSLYVAVVSFHYEMIPLELVYSLQTSISYVPFPPVIELLILQLSLELLREASIRLPPSVATTFGIVGAVVVGTAMVEAGIVSFGALIIVSITAVSSFVQPNIEMRSSIRVLGFPLMIYAAIFGFTGIWVGLLTIFIHLSRIRSFGEPYFVPFAPLKVRDFKDTIVRVPSWMRNKTHAFKKVKKSRKWKLDESEEPY
jgi:spore germination protein KA